MNFVADESVDAQIVHALRNFGYEVVSIAEEVPGIRDEEVLSRATTSRSVLLTADKDFGELVFRQRLLHTGVVLLRLAGIPPARKAQFVATAINAYSADFGSAFSVVTDKAIRIRRSKR